MFARFALYNYSGQPVRFFLVEQAGVPTDETHVAPEVAHHVFMVDRSGSMYYDMRDMKTMLEKLLTIEEFRNSELVCTLISYSSQGDTTVHFERQRVADIMAPGSAAIESVRQLRVTGLTCISQALEQAKDLIKDDETTCISLHSDGYANDRSAVAERRAIDKIITDYQARPNVFINTIAYRSSSDFKLLASIANGCSGKCILAHSVAEVYNALHDTSALLAGQMTPATKIEIGNADYQIFVSGNAGRVNGGSSDLVVRGLKPDDDRTVFRYTEIDEDAFLDSSAPICGDSAARVPILAFAQAQLAEGRLNTSKFALMSTRDTELIVGHYRALTNVEIASFYEDIDSVVIKDVLGVAQTRSINDFYGLGMHKIDVLSLVAILSQYTRDLTVDLGDLYANYTKRGMKRLPGMRVDGAVVEPEYDTRYCGDTQKGQVGRFELNRKTASLQMLVVRPVELVQRSERDGDAITKVAGIELTGDNALHSYNNFTLVGDGTLNLSRLRVKISNKKAFRALVKAEVLTGSYEPDTWYIIDLSELPLVDFEQAYDRTALQGIFGQLAQVKLFGSILGALLKGRSERFTDAQLIELRTYGLSSSLYVNFPTTNAYASLEDALSVGEVDTRPSYNIDLGSTDILHLGQFKSGNANLQRFFTANQKGTPIKKPTWSDWWDTGTSFGYKNLTARTKITPHDDVMKPILENFLGLNPNLSVVKILTMIGGEHLVEGFHRLITRTADPDDVVETITEANKLCSAFTERTYTAALRPLVFYIGATGLLPDELDTQALTAEAIGERYPLLKIGRAEKEGTFFDLGDGVLLSIYVKDVYFATNRSETEAAA